MRRHLGVGVVSFTYSPGGGVGPAELERAAHQALIDAAGDGGVHRVSLQRASTMGAAPNVPA